MHLNKVHLHNYNVDVFIVFLIYSRRRGGPANAHETRPSAEIDRVRRMRETAVICDWSRSLVIAEIVRVECSNVRRTAKLELSLVNQPVEEEIVRAALCNDMRCDFCLAAVNPLRRSCASSAQVR